MATVDRRSKTSISDVRPKANAIIAIINPMIAVIKAALDLEDTLLSCLLYCLR